MIAARLNRSLLIYRRVSMFAINFRDYEIFNPADLTFLYT